MSKTWPQFTESVDDPSVREKEWSFCAPNQTKNIYKGCEVCAEWIGIMIHAPETDRSINQALQAVRVVKCDNRTHGAWGLD